MILLETVGQCVLVLAFLLYCMEQRLFKIINCYGIIYDAGSNLCSCIVSFLPPVADVPHYRPQPSPRHQSQCRYLSHFVINDHPIKVRIPLVLQTKEDKTDTSTTKTVQEQTKHIADCILIFHLINNHLIQVHH